MPLNNAPEDPGATPQTGFESQPNYIPNNVIVLTFDDVPGTNGPAGTPDVTGADLQFFKSQNMHVDFFINTMNYTPNEQDADIMQMLTDGHYLGNHTIHHWHLGQPNPQDTIMACKSDPTCVDNEVGGNETAINMTLGGSKPHLTRFRAPFGEPYQGDGFNMSSDLQGVSTVVAKYAVAFGWNFDSDDSNGMTWDATSLYQNVVSKIGKAGSGNYWGIMLAHGVFPWTRDMLPMLIPYLQQNGFVLGTLEDVACWKWGKHTWDIIPNRTQN